MSDTNTIVEFPAAEAEALRKAASDWHRTGKLDAAPKLQIDRSMSNHIDAGESNFVARQLEFIRAGTYKVQYTDLVYDSLLPINRSVGIGKTEYVARIMDKVGQAEVMAEDVDTMPDVETSTREIKMGFFTIGLGYKYTQTEIQIAMANGIPLVATKAMVCREGIERKINDIALIGDLKATSSSGGRLGLLNTTDSGILTYTPSDSAATGTKTFDKNKSADEMLEDLHGMTSKPWTDSKGIFSINRLLLPLTTRTYLASRRVGDGTNGSVLSYFLGSDQFITSESQVIGLWQLESAAGAGVTGAWTGKRAMGYRADPSALEFFIQQSFEQMAPQAVNYLVKVPCRAKVGGLALYQPLTMIRMDGV
ncbi:MAG TPA: major capsid family protein [Candidatus Paceibacterota bacterium]